MYATQSSAEPVLYVPAAQLPQVRFVVAVPLAVLPFPEGHVVSTAWHVRNVPSFHVESATQLVPHTRFAVVVAATD